MAGTTKAPVTSKKAPARKPAAKRAASPKTAKRAASKKPVEKAETEALENVEELTAADLAVAEEVQATSSQMIESAETAAEEIIETVSEVIEEAQLKGTETMSDMMETTKKYTDEAKERMQSAFAEMSEKTKVNVEKSTKAFEEMSELAKGNVEALVESGKIATKGVESIGQDAAEYGRMTFEKASAAMKSMAAVKSPAEFFQLQSELLSSTFDSFAKETAKNSEAMLKLAGDVAQPISTRVSVVTEKVRSFAA